MIFVNIHKRIAMYFEKRYWIKRYKHSVDLAKEYGRPYIYISEKEKEIYKMYGIIEKEAIIQKINSFKVFYKVYFGR